MSMNEEGNLTGSGQPEEPVVKEVTYEMKSAHEAADFLRVSESTVWRYAAQDILPAYRVGKKRVMFRRSDLEGLLRRVRRQRGATMADKDTLRLTRLSEASGGSGDAMERAREVRERILAARAGVPVYDSWVDINEAREERTADL